MKHVLVLVLLCAAGQEPESPKAADARYAMHLARLQRAIVLATAPGDADRARATQLLDELIREPHDFAVTLARIARASILWNEGVDRTAQEQELIAAFADWQARQPLRVPLPGVEEDVAGIREALFRPHGAGIYDQYRAGFPWPAASTPFLVVNPELPVKLVDGEFETLTIAHRLPDAGRVLFLDSAQLDLLGEMALSLRDLKSLEPDAEIVTLVSRLFPPRSGDWTRWGLEAYPVITEIVFTNAERTKASAGVNLGDTWLTVELEKEGGRWIARRITDLWIA